MHRGEVVDVESQSAEVVPFTRMAEFLRLLAHDVRNDLNAVDLLTAYIRDIAAEPGVRGELDQLRTAIRYGSERMQRLARAFQNPDPEKFPIPVQILVEEFQSRFEQAHPDVAKRVRWEEIPGEGVLSADVVLLGEAVCELLENAAAFSPAEAELVFRVELARHRMSFVVEQPLGNEPGNWEEWGRKPFVSARRGHYGLGLFRVRRLLEALGASLVYVPEPFRGVLQSRVEFSWEGGGR
jgi:signal transduction histidine kinase